LKTEPGALVHTPAHLVDVLPTLAEVSGAKLPETFPGRELRPLAGVSLAPIFAGKALPARPPIHLLFASDRGLRDGDWKLVSFQSEPWELYNLANDRTELRNVAAQHPDIVARMVRQWTEMAENVLMTPARERAPVAEKASGHVHREWSVYNRGANTSSRGEAGTKKKAAKKSTGEPTANALPRARVGTKLAVEGKQLVLECSGDDPGLAFDRLATPLSGGPFTLEFRVQSRASGGGELFWTTDAKTQLPRGQRMEFTVTHDAQWHDLSMKIPETKPLHAFRLDPCAGAGEVRIEGLTLKDAQGKVLQHWP
jgi:arylsulfatase